jgi:hypothetical protein
MSLVGKASGGSNIGKRCLPPDHGMGHAHARLCLGASPQKRTGRNPPGADLERGHQALDFIHSHVRLHKMQASEFVASLEALLSGSAGHGRGRGRRDDG